MALRYTDVGGGELRVVAASPSVRGTLAAAGLDRLLVVFDRLDDALPNGNPPLEPGCPDSPRPSRVAAAGANLLVHGPGPSARFRSEHSRAGCPVGIAARPGEKSP